MWSRASFAAVLAFASLAASSCRRPGDELATASVREPRPARAALDERAFTLAPGERAGLVTPGSSEADLRRAYGEENVSREAVPLGEGVVREGTVLFPDDARRRLEVQWRDEATRTSPARVRVSGDDSAWRFANGVGLGTSLEELERRNGGPLQLLGFAWDGAGIITSFEGGALSSTLGDRRRTTLRLCAAPGKASDEGLVGISGEQRLSSTDPRVRALEPRLCEIGLRF